MVCVYGESVLVAGMQRLLRVRVMSFNIWAARGGRSTPLIKRSGGAAAAKRGCRWFAENRRKGPLQIKSAVD